jgi:2,2-dialkylglycine decarboxylase (pyruvate)
MDRSRIAEIADKWMIPTSKTSYLAGLEKKPVIAAARGVKVIDTDGKEYLDFGSGQMAAALGHNHPRYIAAVERNLRNQPLDQDLLNINRLELHERLGQILTPPLQKSLFLVSGSDAIEAAIDLARKATGGVDVLGLHMALHGSTSFMTRSLTFGWNRGRHGLPTPSTAAILSPFCYRCPVGKEFPSCNVQCLASSMELADANLTAKPAAMIIEPVMSAGGVVVRPAGYVQLLKEYCRARGMLLIMDESQTGLGKTGRKWGAPARRRRARHHDGVETFRCGSAGQRRLHHSRDCRAGGQKRLFRDPLHACDPITCAAGVASIDIVLEENLCERAAAIETRIKTAVTDMARRCDFLGDVRGRGVLLGIELVEDRITREPANEICLEAGRQRESKGLLVQARGSHARTNVIRLVPPMVCTDAEIDEGLGILENVFVTLARNRGAAKRLALA